MASWFEVLNSIDGRLLVWLLLQVSLVALVTYALIGSASNASPAARANVCLVGLACLTILPVVAISHMSVWSWGEWLSRFAPAHGETAADANAGQLANNNSVAETTTTSHPATGWWDQTMLAAAELFVASGQGTANQVSSLQPSTTTVGGNEDETPPLAVQATAPWLILSFGLSILVGCFRLLFGLWLVQRLRRQASPLDDPDLEKEIDATAAELGIRSGISIAVSSIIGSPAIIGWRNPLLLLPKTWNTWTAEERRAVVAHELAHVARCDYLLTASAQLAVAINFFHPLVHALVSRLRLDQELAADGIAARMVGGPQRYVEIVAGLALRQPAVRTPGPAQAFLPTRQMFVRRLEMLRFQDFTHPNRSYWYMASGCVSVLAISVMASGLRPMAANAQQTARQPAVATSTAQPADLLDLIPPGIIEGVVDIDVAALLASEAAKPILDASPDLLAQIGFDLQTLERALILIPSVASKQDNPLVVMQFQEGTKMSNAAVPPEKPGSNTPASLFAANSRNINERMLVVGGTAQLRATLGTLPTDNQFQPLLARHQGQPLRLAGRTKVLRQLLSAPPTGNDPSMMAFAPLWKKVDTLSLGMDVSDELRLKGQLDTSDPTRVSETLSALKILAGNLLSSAADDSRGEGEQDPMQRMLMTTVMGQAKKLLQSVTIETSDSSVQVSARVDSAAYAATAVLLPAVQASRLAAMRMQSANNLKQLMLGLYNYEAAYNHFPPAVVRDAETGVERSWRVEILPFLAGGQRLYEQYRKDEPWDSPANFEVLKQMPRVFAMPGVSSTETPYLAVVSPDGGLTLTNEGKPPRPADITDGTSNTVFLVESKPMVPWTKPVDATDMDTVRTTPMHTGGFNMALGDGAVKFISNNIDNHIWTALTTRSGAEVIPR